ncbi:hypothetical protein CLOP_g10442, partial [Closterium sp. NIES-67]
QPEGEIVV